MKNAEYIVKTITYCQVKYTNVVRNISRTTWGRGGGVGGGVGVGGLHDNSKVTHTVDMSAKK